MSTDLPYAAEVTGLKERQVRHAVKCMEERGVLAKEVHLFAGKTTTHLRIVTSAVAHLVAANGPESIAPNGSE